MTFDQVLNELKNGHKIAIDNWNKDYTEHYLQINNGVLLIYGCKLGPRPVDYLPVHLLFSNEWQVED